MTLEYRADVLVVGGGAAGMYAALEAIQQGADVILLDKSMVGRGGATVKAQMTVAAGLGHAEPDSWVTHFQDTVASGRGLTNEVLAALVCHEAPRRIKDTARMGVKWAKDGDLFDQVIAPGHSRRRCCYVGALQTGPGVSLAMKQELRRQKVTWHDSTFVTRLVREGSGAVAGAAALDMASGDALAYWAGTVILACGGLTEMYARNSASVNMTGDAYALALDVGAELVDMEMVQFFPIANLAPKIIGLDPIMWDPFRYRLGGKLVNGNHEEFMERYTGVADDGDYVVERDMATYAILQEVEAGRGSPAGGVYLDFTELTLSEIRDVFPTAVDRLLAQGIDLSRRPVEVAPMAHFTIGGMRVDMEMATTVPGLYAAGEAVGGMHGANRLSGNAIIEAFVTGARAGECAARAGSQTTRNPDAVACKEMKEAHTEIAAARERNTRSPIFLPALRRQLQDLIWNELGPSRSESGLNHCRESLRVFEEELLPAARIGSRQNFNLESQEFFELRGMLRTAECILIAAAARTESRGAHRRDDYPDEDPSLLRNTILRREGDRLELDWSDVVHLGTAPEDWALSLSASARVD